MSLLTTKKYARIPQQQTELVAVKKEPPTVIQVLQDEEYDLQYELRQIEEAKSREHDLRLRLNVVQQSLQAFRALEAEPDPVQGQQLECFPSHQEKRIRKAATKKTGKPTSRSIAVEPTVSDTENIELTHDDFSTFPE